MRPFCHLVIKTGRVDSPPPQISTLLTEYRSTSHLTQQALSKLFGVSLKTLKNWERGRTKPAKQFWARVGSLLVPRDRVVANGEQSSR